MAVDASLHRLAPADVYAAAGSSPQGLSAAEAARRLAGNALQMVGFAGKDVDLALGDARTCNYALVRPDPEGTGEPTPG